jgi:gliding motility-associated lipoprotein GldH
MPIMQKSSRFFCLGFVLAVALGLASCDRKTAYFHYMHASVSGWGKNDTLTFDVPPLSAGAYREDLGLRIDNSFPFMGICFVIKQTFLPSGYVHCDTVNCRLFGEDGEKKGPGISYSQYLFHINTLRLQEGDSLHICVRHNMKREIMPGVVDVGIRLQKQ